MKHSEECVLILNVIRGTDNRWQVTSEDLGQPIAFFDTAQDACSWAIARAKPKRGRVFVEKTPVDMQNERGSYIRMSWQARPARFTKSQQ